MVYPILAIIGFLMCLNEGLTFPYLNLVGLAIFVTSMKIINAKFARTKIKLF